jgi:hypothetical protein
MTPSWPKSWQGSTDVNCGQDGNFMAAVTTDRQPCGIHEKNFQTIVARWHELWPEFRRIISELMVSYGRARPEWARVNCVYIHTPSEPVVEGGEWSIGVVFRGDDTLWTLPYEGWSACPGQAQAIY